MDSSRLLLARRYLQLGRSIPSTVRGCSECTARFFVPGDLDLWPWHSNSYERRAKHVFRMNLARIRLAVPVIRCWMRVPRIERFSTISRIWRIKGHQAITLNSGVSGPKFTKFLHDVGRTSVLLTRLSAFPRCHPLWNAIPKKEGMSPISADFAPKIGCHGNAPWSLDLSENQYQTEHLHEHVYHP